MRIGYFLLVVLLVFGAARTAQARMWDGEDLTIFAEDFPPYSYVEDKIARGLSVDLLVEMFRRAGIEKTREDVVVVPWARGYRQALKRKNTLLFSTARTTEREDLFKWVGPIGDPNAVLVARKSDNIELNGEFNKLIYGVVQHSSTEQLLLAEGTDPLRMVHMTAPVRAAQMLARGRIDVWAVDRAVALWSLKKHGYKTEDFEVVYDFKSGPISFALNKETDDSLVALLQTSLDAIRADGTLKRIVESYIDGASASFGYGTAARQSKDVDD